MDKTELIALKDVAEKRAKELFQQVNDIQVELERVRGDFRTYEGLLSNWKEKVETVASEVVDEVKKIEVTDNNQEETKE